MRWNHRIRRNLLVVISMLCLAAAAAMLYGQRDLGRADRLGTPTVAMLLGMMLLPGATFAARRVERRLRRERIERMMG
ncbi:MAG: hypothetical protein JNK58_14205 [Phycisphaerae bacterium]|nr:hypothetical protein [Phycisphaerae bacterium]